MHLASRPRDAEFTPADHGDTQIHPGGTSLSHTPKRVVIGEGNDVQSLGRGATNDLGGSVFTIGGG
jgi:hypothetical protein